jgi:alkanesulfonate monooxygenase SsuD/methylene tetrahydromethanopterin reductase-like flavin-dependent oxidoreductase (luciferase family)
MKVGIIQGVRNHPSKPYPLQQVYADYISDAVLAEELGFDFSWYGEHHGRPCQWTPSPLLVGAAVAAKTKRIRIGSSILCLPFHDPLRIAEDVAVLDVISGGRFDLGIGVGSQYEEFENFGIPSAEKNGRMWESIEFIERCFYGEDIFTHKGKYYEFPNITFTTKPVQKRVPVWAGVMGPKNVERAAEKGYHLLAGGSPQYDAALRRFGRNPDDYFVAPMLHLAIAETTDAAWDASLEGLHYFMNFYQLRKRLDGTIPPPSAEITREMIRAGKTFVPGERGALVGTPKEVLKRFLEIRDGVEGRVTHLPMQVRHPGMRTEDVHRTMRLFAQEILPHLRAK